MKGLFLFSLISTCSQLIKEACAPKIPAENWANKELINQDRLKGISEQEFHKNLVNGKYRMTTTYPEPHRDSNGKIIIENSLLYQSDVKEFGAYQAMKWVRQGKYNLMPEELEKEKARIRAEFERLGNL